MNDRDKGKYIEVDIDGIEAIAIKKFGTRIANLETKKHLQHDEKLNENLWLKLKSHQSIVGIKMHFDTKFGNLYGIQFKLM